MGEGENLEKKTRVPITPLQGLHTASPQTTSLPCTGWEVSLPPPLVGGVVCHLEISLASLEIPAPASRTPAKECTRGRGYVLPEAYQSICLQPLPLFEKPRKEYFPHSAECPTSIWLPGSATSPPGSAPRSPARLDCMSFSPDKAQRRASPGHFPQMREMRRAPTRGFCKSAPPAMEQSKRQGETRRPAPATPPASGDPRPAPRQGAACAHGHPWLRSAARPPPPRAPRVPKQLLYLLNLETAGY